MGKQDFPQETINMAEDMAYLETQFNSKIGYNVPDGGNALIENKTITLGNDKQYKVFDIFEFDNQLFPNYPDVNKAAALKDLETGEIIFHFNGTGDGNWLYNAAAYGKDQPSEMQIKAQEWFDATYEKLVQDGEITNDTKIYVTGHSQGGNNAMYVTMTSKYGDEIDSCIPLDGPGFSDEFVAERKTALGEKYNERINKMWAVNGENDFVSILGQNCLVSEKHTVYVKYSLDKINFASFHASEGMVRNGKFVEVLDDDSALRKRLSSAVSKIKELPQEDQEIAAQVIMIICENPPGKNDKEPRQLSLTQEQLDKIKPLLIPVVEELLTYDPDSLVSTIQTVLGDSPESVETAQAISDLIKKINSYPKEYRDELLASLLDLVSIKDGKIDFDTSKIPLRAVTALPLIFETLLTNSDDVITILQNSGVIDGFIDWVKENPFKFAGCVILGIISAPIVMPLVKAIEFAAGLADFGIRIVQIVVELGKKVKEFFVDLFESVKNAINKIKEWFRNKTNKGVDFAEENPYFKADTDRLYHYSSRLNTVNRRLRELDGDMRSLYWQVGFLDLWDVLSANILVHESVSLRMASNYLSDTARRLNDADRKAKGYLEGR